MIVKNIKYIIKYFITNEITIPIFCKQCKITIDTFNRMLEGKRIGFISYYKIRKKLNVSLKRLQNI